MTWQEIVSSVYFWPPAPYIALVLAGAVISGAIIWWDNWRYNNKEGK